MTCSMSGCLSSRKPIVISRAFSSLVRTILNLLQGKQIGFFFSAAKKHAVDNPNDQSISCKAKNDRKKLTQKTFHGDLLFGLSQSIFDFLVRLVLPKGVNRPNHGWNPADQRELHHKTEKTCKWTTNREKGQPWQQKRNQKSHGWDVRIVLNRTQVSTGWLTTNLHWSLK